MTPHAHGGLLVVLVAFALGVAAGNMALLPAPALRERLECLAPRELSRLTRTLLGVPVLLGSAFVMATLVVPAMALGSPELDHCDVGADAPHLCFVHGTWTFDSVWEGLGVASLLTLAATTLGWELAKLWRARRVAASLLDGERPEALVSQTNDDEPFAFTVGVLRPRVIVSAGLARVLTEEQLSAAIAHERAHARRRHAFGRVASRVVGAFVVPPLKNTLLDLLILAQEQEADDDAAAEVESRALVAETLLACVRSSRSRRPAFAVPALFGPALEERVEALCRPPRERRITGPLALLVCVVVACVAVAHEPLHRVSERVASVLFSSPVHHHGGVSSRAAAE